MVIEESGGVDDRWAAWLLERRCGGDQAMRKTLLDYLGPVRDRVLGNTALEPGDVLLDVGTGDGLIAFGALRRLGEEGRVVFSDVSEELLEHCRDLAERLGVAERCRFVRAAAEDLSAIASASVDAVTTRSVLIYVADKQRAFAEFARVLRPGGRLSLFEPINRYFGLEPPRGQWWGGYDITPVQELADRVDAVYERAQPRDLDPMLDFDDRDLVRLAEQAGFGPVRLTLEVEVEPGGGWHPSWDAFYRSAPNPNAPTLEEAVTHALSATEAEVFTSHLRTQVEQRQGVR
ncbi:MAG: class I SAM-dependent methyltransferase [Actinomycetota bacterium]|nr:class I SAM-dependent methyltransferase [Actinomycetota bacterium]